MMKRNQECFFPDKSSMISCDLEGVSKSSLSYPKTRPKNPSISQSQIFCCLVFLSFSSLTPSFSLSLLSSIRLSSTLMTINKRSGKRYKIMDPFGLIRNNFPIFCCLVFLTFRILSNYLSSYHSLSLVYLSSRRGTCDGNS